MVALINGEDVEVVGEDPAAERLPVIARAEQAVEDDQRRPGAVAFIGKRYGGRIVGQLDSRLYCVGVWGYGRVGGF